MDMDIEQNQILSILRVWKMIILTISLIIIIIVIFILIADSEYSMNMEQNQILNLNNNDNSYLDRRFWIFKALNRYETKSNSNHFKSMKNN